MNQQNEDIARALVVVISAILSRKKHERAALLRRSISMLAGAEEAIRTGAK